MNEIVTILESMDAKWSACEEAMARQAASTSTSPEAEREWGRQLARQFQEQGFLRYPPTEALRWSDLAIVAFYQALATSCVCTHRGRAAASPDWMLASDYAFVNVRACSPDADRTGRVLDALKVIPTMRVNSIHLAPIFDCSMQNLYAVESVRVVNPELLDARLVEAGIDGEDQVRLLVDGIHRLGWTVGFDLEPHTGTFSRVALQHPDCFRWLRFDARRDGLCGGVAQEDMLAPEAQERLAGEVRSIVAAAVCQAGLSFLEDTSHGMGRVIDCHRAITSRLIAEGYWTLPSHTWNGVGLPRFDHYKKAEGFPDYEYLDAEGEDQHKHSFGMLSPFRLYDRLPVNASPDLEEKKPVIYGPGVDLLGSIFPDVRDRFGFDFVRLDYVDHVFDSTVEETWDVPASDRLTPALLQGLLARAREGAPGVGAMAERMGTDVEDYGSLGFDLLLGNEVLTTLHPDFLSFVLRLQQELDGDRPTEIITASVHPPADTPTGRPCSVMAAVDTHDSGHPLFWTVSLSQAVGADGIFLRHFVARFASCGPRRRPKYECMGNQDLSWGLYEANNKSVTLHWEGDRAFNERYHQLEDVYGGLRAFLATARIGPWHVDKDGGWGAWFLDGAEGTRERLLCVVALEPEVEKVSDWVKDPPELKPCGPVRVDVTISWPADSCRVDEIRLDGAGSEAVALEGSFVALQELKPRECRLFRICRHG